jgi:hypothetical protein
VRLSVPPRRLIQAAMVSEVLLVLAGPAASWLAS